MDGLRWVWVSLSPSVPRFITSHRCAGLGPFGREPVRVLVSALQLESLRFSKALVVSDSNDESVSEIGPVGVLDGCGVQPCHPTKKKRS